MRFRICRGAITHNNPRGGKNTMTKLKSGETAPVSGTYNVVNENGTMVGTVYVRKGDTMPPTQSEGDHFEI